MKCTCTLQNAYVVRIPRSWWMRLLPFSKHYRCTHCEARFMRFAELHHDDGAPLSLHPSAFGPGTEAGRIRKRVRAGTAPR